MIALELTMLANVLFGPWDELIFWYLPVPYSIVALIETDIHFAGLGGSDIDRSGKVPRIIVNDGTPNINPHKALPSDTS